MTFEFFCVALCLQVEYLCTPRIYTYIFNHVWATIFYCCWVLLHHLQVSLLSQKWLTVCWVGR